MTDAEWLLAIVAAIYAADCAQWAPFDAVAFVSARRGRLGSDGYCVRFPSFALGASEGALIWGDLFPPLGASMLAQDWPIAVSPDGALAYSSSSLNPHQTPAYTERFVAWDDAPQISVRERTVLVDGEPFVQACSRPLAAWWGRFMHRLAHSAASERGAMIDAALARRVHRPSIEGRRASFEQRTVALRATCNLLWLHLFAGGALLVWWPPARGAWAPLLLGLAVLMGAIIGLFRRAYRRLYRRQRSKWRGHGAMMLFSPMEAIRAYDLAGREAFSLFDPLAIAGALCSADETARFARRIALDLAHPLPRKSSLPQRSLETWRWFHAKREAQVREQLAELGLNWDELLTPPEPLADDCLAYCPRCETQFVIPAGCCTTCGNIPFLPLR